MAPIPAAQPSSHASNPENQANPIVPVTVTATQEAAHSKKRKRKEKPHILHAATFKKQIWAYMHVELVTPDTAVSAPAPASTPHTPHAETSTSTATAQPSSSAPQDHISSPSSLDPLTIPLLLTPALSSFLGLTGSAIPLDILKTSGRHVWLRVPRQDVRAVQASLAGWVGMCEGALVPGSGPGSGSELELGSGEGRVREGGMGTSRVRVAWRVRGVEGVLGMVGKEGERDGGDLFGG